MSEVKWTPKQQAVIDAKDNEILVSAAAGSGKTAVLVERIIKKVLDKNNPIDIDKIVVVTFTEAAAGEMRQRVLKAIEKAAETDNTNEHLQRQLTYIHNAKISTIHGFCLNVIRENFNKIDIDPGFRVGDEGELKLLMSDIISDMLEEYYDKGEEEFITFVENYAGGRSDKEIEDLIFKLYKFKNAYPYPEDFFDMCINNYNEPLDKNSWYIFISNYIKEYLNYFKDAYKEARQYCLTENGPEKYTIVISDELDSLEKITKLNDFFEIGNEIKNISFDKLPTIRKGTCDDDMKDKVKDTRDAFKKYISDLKESFYVTNKKETIEFLKETKKNLLVLIRLVEDFSNRYSLKKKEDSIIDFNDMEHMALKILVTKENGKLIPTNVAKEMSNEFEEIMVDEYQDSNYVQEAILKSISKDYINKPNMFMVGDVKQSIYKFRMASPELFLHKFNSYSEEKSLYQKIILDKNFRSRKEVLDSVNFVFKQIMTKAVGNIVYDDSQSLYLGANFKEIEVENEFHETIKVNQDNTSEIVLVEIDSKYLDEDSNEEYKEDSNSISENDLGKIELEALACSTKIKELIDKDTGMLVFDKDTNTYKRATYKDIVILFRSHKSYGEVYQKVLTAKGIPTYCEVGEGYFDTKEVMLMLNLLKIIDNPLMDIEFCSILKAPFVDFKDNELATIKANTPQNIWFYQRLLYVKENETSIKQELKDKVIKFLEKLEHYKTISKLYGIYELIKYLLDDTGYYNYVLAMPAGKKRAGNLDILLQKAIDYQNTSYIGLFNFVRYIEKLKKVEIDFGEAKTISEQDNTVRIMSVHKSKGLEFPIVVIGGMSKHFNNMDANSEIVMESSLGIGLDYRNPIERIKEPTIIGKAISQKIKIENIGEELRVLYVAMTRAKEKLIMIGCVDDKEEYMKKRKGNETNPFTFYRMSKSTNWLDFICDCYISYINPPFILNSVNLRDLSLEEVKNQSLNIINKESLVNWDCSVVFDTEIKNNIKSNLEYVYPFEKENVIHTKVSVSELKKSQIEENDYHMFKTQKEDEEPDFITNKNEALNGAKRGSLYHRIFEIMDFKALFEGKSLEEEFNRIKEKELIEEDFINEINKNIINNFINSNICHRMALAQKNNKLKKEQPFVIGIKAKEIYKETNSDETVLIQGVIDAYFEENNEFVIVDYKTDRVLKADELIKRYKVQLDLYKRAIEQITGKKVKETIIYSTRLNEEIYIN